MITFKVLSDNRIQAHLPNGQIATSLFPLHELDEHQKMNLNKAKCYGPDNKDSELRALCSILTNEAFARLIK